MYEMTHAYLQHNLIFFLIKRRFTRQLNNVAILSALFILW